VYIYRRLRERHPQGNGIRAGEFFDKMMIRIESFAARATHLRVM
jgi:hypothetical protein